MNRVTFTVIGYLLILFGMISLVLAFIGLSFAPLSFLDRLIGPLGSFLVKLLMVIGGMILFYVARVPQDDD